MWFRNIHCYRFTESFKLTGKQIGEAAAARFDADFALMAPELGQLIPALLQAVGGKD